MFICFIIVLYSIGFAAQTNRIFYCCKKTKYCLLGFSDTTVTSGLIIIMYYMLCSGFCCVRISPRVATSIAAWKRDQWSLLYLCWLLMSRLLCTCTTQRNISQRLVYKRNRPRFCPWWELGRLTFFFN